MLLERKASAMEKVFEYIKNNPGITVDQLHTNLKRKSSRHATYFIVRRLESSGYITFMGKGITKPYRLYAK